MKPFTLRLPLFFLLIWLHLPLFAVGGAVSSRLSDQQVINLITEAVSDGKSQQEISTMLFKKGVTESQLKRVREKYKQSQETQSTTDGQAVTETTHDATIRLHNGLRQSRTKDKKKKNDTALKNDSVLTAVLQLDEEDKPLSHDADKEDDTQKIFGHDIFNNDEVSFEPNLNISAPAGYVLGPGDEVQVDIFGATQASYTETINAEGFIVIDQYGPLHLSGFTLAEAQRYVAEEIGSMYESSAVRISVGQTRTVQVNIMGEVNVPGTYSLSAFSTVFHALYAAGGVTERGTLRTVKVYRGGKEKASVDIYAYILSGNESGGIKLQDGDVIIVNTYQSIVTAEGQLKRPMRYEMKPGETLRQLLAFTGGFAAGAYTDAVRVNRSSGKRSTVFNVPSAEVGAFQLKDGDVISVDQHQDRYEDIVEVRGAVFRPGLYHLDRNLSTLTDLLHAADGLTESAVSNHALIYRKKADRTHTMIAVDLDAILAGRSANLPLANEDILYVPSTEELLARRTVQIQGDVLNPGEYEYTEHETVKDLILQAGGLLETASLARVDVARTRLEPNAPVENGLNRAEFFSLELHEGLVISPLDTFFLQPFDIVQVRRSPVSTPLHNVEIRGMVQFEGIYSLTLKEERLSDLVTKAGGFKEFAYIHGAILRRQLDTDERFNLTNQINSAWARGDTLVATELQSRLERPYSVGIDLAKAIHNPGSTADLVLQEGDILYIPQLNNTVKVSGEVLYPNTVTYEKGMHRKYYVGQAGGYTDEARKHRMYVVYPNGQTARLKKHTQIAPGSEVVVPAKVHRDMTSKASTYIAIASSLATIAALIVNILK